MIFLIQYSRSKGRIVTFEKFDDSHWHEADEARLHLELDLNHRGIDHEVVLLEANDEGALRLTHRRYFEDLRQILESHVEAGVGSE